MLLEACTIKVNFRRVNLFFCLKGSIYDVALDIRKGSETFGKYIGVNLSADTPQAFYVPPGFAHGFAVSESSNAIILYKCTRLYQGAYDSGISWASSNIKLPKNFIDTKKAILSSKDSVAPSLTEELAVSV